MDPPYAAIHAPVEPYHTRKHGIFGDGEDDWTPQRLDTPGAPTNAVSAGQPLPVQSVSGAWLDANGRIQRGPRAAELQEARAPTDPNSVPSIVPNIGVSSLMKVSKAWISAGTAAGPIWPNAPAAD